MLSPSLSTCVKGCKQFIFTDTTNIYDEINNLNGWGEPNLGPENITNAYIKITSNCNNTEHIYNVTNQIPSVIEGCFQYAPFEVNIPQGEFTIEYVIEYTVQGESQIIETESTCENDNIVLNGTFDEDLDNWGGSNFVQSGGVAMSTINETSSLSQVLAYSQMQYILSFDYQVEGECEISTEILMGTTSIGFASIGYNEFNIYPGLAPTIFNTTPNNLIFLIDDHPEGCHVIIDNVCARPFLPVETEVEGEMIEGRVTHCETYLNDCKFRCCIDKLIASIPKYLCNKCDTRILEEILLIEAMYIGYISAAACDKENIRKEIEKRLERFCNFKECKC
jgi:hypothetical protein